jgi:hypothetical protein
VVPHHGAPVAIRRRAEVVEDEPLGAGTPTVVQVSHWDAVKDPLGVIHGFAEHVPVETGADLVYAGPSLAAVADNPEGVRPVRDLGRGVGVAPGRCPSAYHLVTLPLEDLVENAVVVNALQRHARIVVQRKAVRDLLEEPERAGQLGRNARERVRQHFLSSSDLLDYLGMIRGLLGDSRRRRRLLA